MKGTRFHAPAPIRYGLVAVLAFFWIAGCDVVAKPSPRQSQRSEGTTAMNPAQTAAAKAIPIPAIDATEPKRLEIATFATG